MTAIAGRFILNRYYMREMQGKTKNVSFCELLKPVGNLKAYNWDFDRLWRDFEATELRRRVQRGCHCTHECFQTKNLIFSPWRLL